MAIQRLQRKIERTPEQLAVLRAVRDQIQRDRPTQDELLADGDHEGPFRHADTMDLLRTLATWRAERERQGLSLADMAARTGLDKAMLSRLETGKILNPTLATLMRYSEALGRSLRLRTVRSRRSVPRVQPPASTPTG